MRGCVFFFVPLSVSPDLFPRLWVVLLVVVAVVLAYASTLLGVVVVRERRERESAHVVRLCRPSLLLLTWPCCGGTLVYSNKSSNKGPGTRWMNWKSAFQVIVIRSWPRRARDASSMTFGAPPLGWVGCCIIHSTAPHHRYAQLTQGSLLMLGLESVGVRDTQADYVAAYVPQGTGKCLCTGATTTPLPPS